MDREPQLSIGELARRSGVATATLRSWEARYGFPTADHRPGTHRRYHADQVDLVAEVARLRQTGLSVPAAVAAAREAATRPARSFFAALASGDGPLRSHILKKPALGAVTTAIEDECLAQARRPVLIGAFQQGRFYRQSEARWQELARTAEQSVVFADFEVGRAPADHPAPHPAGHPTEVPLPADSPVRREWALVCDAPGFTACVAGWELPSPPDAPDSERRFETIWTLDPGPVRAAARVAIALLRKVDPGLSDSVAASLAGPTRTASPDLIEATALFGRIVEYTQDAWDPLDPA